jgi:hypothetical protein
LTILETGLNKEIGNRKWEIKRGKYPKSACEITKSIATMYSHWTTSQVRQRQEWLAAKANSLWRVNQFDP